MSAPSRQINIYMYIFVYIFIYIYIYVGVGIIHGWQHTWPVLQMSTYKPIVYFPSIRRVYLALIGKCIFSLYVEENWVKYSFHLCKSLYAVWSTYLSYVYIYTFWIRIPVKCCLKPKFFTRSVVLDCHYDVLLSWNSCQTKCPISIEMMLVYFIY